MPYTPYEDQTFQTRYSLTQAPAANGRYIQHQIQSQYSPDGQTWTDDQAFTINVPAQELETVLAMPDGAAKVQAYKQLLQDNRSTIVRPSGGHGPAAIQRRANETARSAAAAAEAVTYINSVKPDYPVTFTL